MIGGVATLFLMVACGAVVASSGASHPAAPPAGSGGSAPAAGGGKGDENKEPKKVTNGIGRELDESRALRGQVGRGDRALA